ncbi:MAG: glycosyltransferase family 4 protein [Thermoleophilia bacterium]
MPERGSKIWLTVFTGNSGLTHYSFCLARALAAAGADVSLITNSNYELDSFRGGFPVEKVFHRSRRYPLDIIRFWRRYRRERPAVVHYQAFLKFPALEIFLIKLQKRSGARVVYTAHDWLPHRRRRYHRMLFGSFYRQFDRIIVHSQRGADFLAGELSVDPDRIRVIPHGEYGFFDNDPDMDRAGARQRLGLDPDITWFLFFGHIDRYKGLDVALGALGRLYQAAAETPPTGLIIAGNPGRETFAQYEKLIGDAGLSDKVSLHLGHIPVSELQAYFKAADALLLPYRESSTSGLAHVAMGFGLPVIASNIGGLPGLVAEAGAGEIVEPGDEDGLAAAMAGLAGDSEKMKRMGAAWQSVADKYSWDNIAGRTIDLYRSLRR